MLKSEGRVPTDTGLRRVWAGEPELPGLSVSTELSLLLPPLAAVNQLPPAMVLIRVRGEAAAAPGWAAKKGDGPPFTTAAADEEGLDELQGDEKAAAGSVWGQLSGWLAAAASGERSKVKNSESLARSGEVGGRLRAGDARRCFPSRGKEPFVCTRHNKGTALGPNN